MVEQHFPIRKGAVPLAEDPHGKILWERVTGELPGQAADQAALTGRAKDLLGVATISSTITGAILNDKLFQFSQIEIPAWWLVLAALPLLMVLVAGLWAVQTKEYSFAPDAAAFYEIEQKYPNSTEGDLYRALAEGYLFEAEDGKTQLQRNRDILGGIELLVRVETAGIIGVAGMAFVLVFLIEKG